MNIAFREHESAARIIAKELEDNGYAVFLEPAPEQIPFSLGGYRPDLLATKDNDNLIIEIKSKKSAKILERYRKVADIIQAHPGWKFLVKTFADAPRIEETAAPSVSDIKTIAKHLEKAERAASSDAPELAIPYLWNIIISLLRNKAIDTAPKFSELPDRSLINQLYSLGELSVEQYEALRKWQELRNQAIHNLEFSVDSKEVKAMLAFGQRLFSEVR